MPKLLWKVSRDHSNWKRIRKRSPLIILEHKLLRRWLMVFLVGLCLWSSTSMQQFQMLKQNWTKKANVYPQDVWHQWKLDTDLRLIPVLNLKLMESNTSRNWLASWDGLANLDELSLRLKYLCYLLTLHYYEQDTYNKSFISLAIWKQNLRRHLLLTLIIWTSLKIILKNVTGMTLPRS